MVSKAESEAYKVWSIKQRSGICLSVSSFSTVIAVMIPGFEVIIYFVVKLWCSHCDRSIVRVHLCHLVHVMNAESTPCGRQSSDQADVTNNRPWWESGILPLNPGCALFWHLVIITNRVSGQGNAIGRVRPSVSTISFEPSDVWPRLFACVDHDHWPQLAESWKSKS